MVEDALDANNTIARANRSDFDRESVAVVNLMSAPGVGKTLLLERVLEHLDGGAQGCSRATSRAAWMPTDWPASMPVTQINTGQGFGGECHPRREHGPPAVLSLPMADIDLLVIENVGNLVCPAEFGLGEDARVMVSSVTEGEDKPLKYPLMFRACELVLVNKVDLLPHLDFDLERFLYNLETVNPEAKRIVLSARTGEGVEEWRRWLVQTATRVASAGLASGRRARPGRATRVEASDACRRGSTSCASRTAANERFFTREADRGGHPGCHQMAEQLARAGAWWLRQHAGRTVRRAPRGGRVRSPGDRREAALPAIALASEGGLLRRQIDLAAEPDDMAIAFGTDDRDEARGSDDPGWSTASASAPPATGVPHPRVLGRGAEWQFDPLSEDLFAVGRSSRRRSTTCSGSSATCSSSTAACSPAGRHGRCTTPARPASTCSPSPSAARRGARGRPRLHPS